MIEELSTVVLTTDLPRHGPRAGDFGTVVLVREAGAGYSVEFSTLGGETVAMTTLTAERVRPTRPNDIAHARETVVAP